MFDLQKSIAEWRKQMLAAGIHAPVPLDELENHLREEIERQIKSGLNAQTAFPIAVEKIGQANLLKTEFRKAGGTDKTRQRKAACYSYAVILIFYVVATTYAMFKNNLSANEWRLGMAAQATMLFLVWFVWRIALRSFPRIRSRRVQSAVGLIGGVSGAIWIIVFVHSILPHFDFTTDQLMVAVLWAMVPALVLPTTAFLILDKSENQLSDTTGL